MKPPCSTCGRETAWGGDCEVHLDEVVIVERPQMTVTAFRTNGSGERIEISFDANQLALVTHESRWHLAFQCSGSMTLIPAGDVKEIRFAARGATWCMSCDGRLAAYPSADPSYHRIAKTEAR